MKRAALIFLLALLAATPAHSYWRASGTGTGTASTDTLGGSATPTASASGQTVTVSFRQTSFHGGSLGDFTNGGYTIRRLPGPVTPTSGPCAAVVSGGTETLSCTETDVPFGDWTYTVQPGLDDSWTGTQSAESNTVEVAPSAPGTLTATATPGGQISLSWAASSGATSYALYRATAASGSFTLRATPAGNSHTDTGTHGVTYHYRVRAVAVGNESPDSPTASATADSTVPTGVTLTSPGSPLRGAVALSGTASDTGIGIATVAFQYTTAGGSSWTTACTATTSPYGCSWATTDVADGLYDLRVVATDGAGNATSSAAVTNRRVDNTTPTVGITDPGAFIRGTVSLVSSASDAGSGLASVRVQSSPTGAGIWTDICVGTSSASPCSLDTTMVTDGAYDLRVIAVDAAGNESSATVTNRIVDNTKPTGTDIQTTNVTGGTPGQPETGDAVTFSFSEPILSSSVLSGWTGSSTTVTVRISLATPSLLTVFNAGNTAPLPLGSVDAGRNYALSNLVFNNSTMVRSGATITVTLGTLALGGLPLSQTGNADLSWTTVATPTDLAGNTLTVETIAESGAGDGNF